jgi:hypothetical protein
MKSVSWFAAALGILIILVAIVGRFHGAPSVTLFGSRHTATTFLLAGNTLLLLAIFLAAAFPPPKQ